LPNVLGTPHYSAWTQAMIERRMRRIAENLDALAEGRPLQRIVMLGAWVDPDVS
jgi:phosphoglycerate dehydrogenase-like enzyme